MAKLQSGQDTMENMLTVSEVAALLHIHVNTVRRWNNQGIIKAYRIGPRGVRRFRQQDIFTFLNKAERISEEKFTGSRNENAL